MRVPSIFSFTALLFVSPVSAADVAPVSVMIVGDFHMSNPGHDLHNVHVDDMLTPKRQAEIQAVVDGIAKFNPTMVDAEWDEPYTSQKYAEYLKGTLPASSNEVVQLGFRLGKQLRIPVHGIDVDGDFPYEAVETYAKAHGQTAVLDTANAKIERVAQDQDALLRTGDVSRVLRYLNDPVHLDHGNDFYREMLLVGGGKDQPGADLLTAWYKRNFYICANLLQLAKPGDRVVVFYGSGHAFLLRQCISEMPGYRLIEANGYLPD